MRESALQRGLAINLLGALIPLAVSLVTVPIYVHTIGDARYGVLSIVWVLLGYLGFLDLGLSRAAANTLSKLRNATQCERAQIIVTSAVCNLLFGLVGSAALSLGGMFIFIEVLSVPPDLLPEIQHALPWVAGLLPLALVSGVGIGALESRERFLAANLFQVCGTSAGQVIPMLLAVTFSPSLAIVVPAAAVTRGITVLGISILVSSHEGPLRLSHFKSCEVKRLLRYGGWISVSAVISPIMTTLDQFVIGSSLGVSAVAHYAVPMSLILRSQVIPSALTRTLFPRLSHLDGGDAERLAGASALTLGCCYAVLVCPAIFLLQIFLKIWLGERFSNEASGLGEILLVGAWINGLAFIPGGLIQARGRPDITAKFHLLELVPFILMLWGLITVAGLKGAAFAWTLRVFVDACLLFYASRIASLELVLKLTLFLVAIVGSLVVQQSLSGNLMGSVLCSLLAFIIPLLMAFSFDSNFRRVARGPLAILRRCGRAD